MSLFGWLTDLLRGWVQTNLEDMFYNLTVTTNTISTELSTSPTVWNGGAVFDMIRQIAEQVALPIAALIFTFVITWELITLLTQGNSFGDVDVLGVLIKWLIKTIVAAILISNSLNLSMSFFEVGGDMVQETYNVMNAATGAYTYEDKTTTVMDFFSTYLADDKLEEKHNGSLFAMGLLTTVLNLIMKIMSILVTVVLTSRMISIYLHCAVCPIPAATLMNSHMNNVGMNFLKSVFALAMQAVVMMICVAIYGMLLQTVINPADALEAAKDAGTIAAGTDEVASALSILNSVILKCVGLAILLVFTLFKSEQVTKTIFAVQ